MTGPRHSQTIATGHTTWLTLVAVLAVGGCVDDLTTVPQPQPVPSPLRSQMRISSPTPDVVKRLVVGLPGATAGAGRLRALERDAPQPTTLALATCSDAGTFALVLPTADLDRVMVRYEDSDGRASNPVPLAAPQTYGDLLLAPANSRGPQVVSAPDAAGLVTVTNDDGAGDLLIAASPDVVVLVTNAASGDVVESTTDSQGRFEVQLPGATGDAVQILLVDPTDDALTSDFLDYQVP